MTITIYNNKNKKVYTSHHIDCKCFSVKSVLILSSLLHTCLHTQRAAVISIFISTFISKQRPQIKFDMMNIKQTHAKGDRQTNIGMSRVLSTSWNVI